MTIPNEIRLPYRAIQKINWAQSNSENCREKLMYGSRAEFTRFPEFSCIGQFE